MCVCLCVCVSFIDSGRRCLWCFGQTRGDQRVSMIESVRTEKLDSTHSVCWVRHAHTHTDDTLLMLEDTTRCCFWLKALLLLTDIKVKEQSEENMMRLEPLSSFSCS